MWNANHMSTNGIRDILKQSNFDTGTGKRGNNGNKMVTSFDAGNPKNPYNRTSSRGDMSEEEATFYQSEWRRLAATVKNLK